MKTLRAVKKPDTKVPKGLDGNEKEHKREFLAEIVEDGEVIDDAYFETKEDAERWARDVYKINS